MDNENPITDEIDETEVQDGGEAGNEDRQEQAETEGGAAESAEEPGDGDRGRKQTHELNAAAKAARKQAERETEERMRGDRGDGHPEPVYRDAVWQLEGIPGLFQAFS